MSIHSKHVVLLCIAVFLVACTLPVSAAPADLFGSNSNSTNNWVVIISTSRYWHNYRHTSNALSFYHMMKDNGISDNRIILMLPDSYACDPRNDKPGTIFNNKENKINLYSCDVEVDVNGYEVDIQSALSTLQGRYDADTPISRQLRSDENSNVLVYITGHGGEDFIKFQDQEYLNGEDISRTIAMMAAQKRFKNLLFVAETCHAQSLCSTIDTPNVACVGSALREEDTYSHHMNSALGVWATDSFTYYTLQFMESQKKVQEVYLKDWVRYYKREVVLSTVNWKGLDEYGSHWKIGDFFGYGKGSGWSPIAVKSDLF